MGHLFEGAGLFEQVGGAGDDLEPLFDPQVLQRFAVHIDDRQIQAANDEQRGGFDAGEDGDGEVGAAASGNDRANVIGPLGGGNQGGGSTG
jgi:hypothetical protein